MEVREIRSASNEVASSSPKSMMNSRRPIAREAEALRSAVLVAV